MKSGFLWTLHCALIFKVLLLCSSVSGAIYPADHFTQVRSNHGYGIDGAPSLGEQIPDFQRLLAHSDLDHIDPDVQTDLITDLIVPQYFRQFAAGLLQQDGENPADKLFAGIESDNCKAHIFEFLLMTTDLKKLFDLEDDSLTWVLHMIDSWGKIPEGILSGHLNVMGDFDECIELKARGLETRKYFFPGQTDNQFEGRYCTVYIADYGSAMNNTKFPIPPEGSSPARTSMSSGRSGSARNNLRASASLGELATMIAERLGVNLIPSIGVCFPNSCNRNDIQQFLINSLDMLYTNNSDSGPTPPENGTPLYPTNLPWPLTIACYQKEKPAFDWADISVIALLIIFLVFCLVAGAVDYCLNYNAEQKKKQGKVYEYVMAFSMYANIKAWMSTKRPAGDFGCLHGLRFFSTSWIILSHTYYAVNFLPNWNMVDVKKVHEDWFILTVLNSSLSVDTFFVIAGMLITYNTMKTLDRDKGKLNIPKTYVKRYFRLTPPYAILVGVMATIIPYMGNGPYWVVMNNWAQFCESNWWTNLLYVNNLVNTSALCQGETWYLANDMQFTLLSPFIVYPIWKWELFGLILLAIYTIMSCIAPMLVVYFMDISPTVIPTRDYQDFTVFRHLYIVPYTRIATYLVGIWLGWIFFKTKGKKVRLPWLVQVAFWTMSTAVAPAVIYAIFPWFDPKKGMNQAAAMAYAGLGRFAFGVAVSWIIFACCKGMGGIVNSFLSWKVFMPLARLCYCVYLVSLHLQMILHIRFTQPIKYDPYVQMNFFFSHMVMSFLVGLMFWLTFEQPFIILQKLIFDSKPKKKTPVNPQAVVSEAIHPDSQTILRPGANKGNSAA